MLSFYCPNNFVENNHWSKYTLAVKPRWAQIPSIGISTPEQVIYWTFFFYHFSKFFHWDFFLHWLFIWLFLSAHLRNEGINALSLFIVTSSMLMFERHLRKISANTSELASTTININIVWKWQLAHKGATWTNLEYLDKTGNIRLRHPSIVPVAVSGVAFDICLEILI